MEEWGRSIEVNDDEHCLFLALRIGYFYVYSVEQNAWIHFSEYTRSLRQARHQDLAAGGVKNQKGWSHFKNTVMDACSNRWAKREMGGTDFKWGGRAPLVPPLATALGKPCLDLAIFISKTARALIVFVFEGYDLEAIINLCFWCVFTTFGHSLFWQLYRSRSIVSFLLKTLALCFFITVTMLRFKM